MSKTNQKRIWEIDLARGILIILMIILHILFNLEYFYKVPINYSYGFVNIVRVIVASSFILISGVSTSFSKNSFKRGLMVFFVAIIITIITYIFDNDAYIIFGILHMLGVCMMISPILKRFNISRLFILLIILILINHMIFKIQIKNNYFFMLGLRNEDFISLDYYPLLPWSSIFIVGILLNKIIYKKKKSIFSFQIKDNFISFLGRNSLLVYIVHQPIILVVMFLFSKL